MQFKVFISLSKGKLMVQLETDFKIFRQLENKMLVYFDAVELCFPDRVVSLSITGIIMLNLYLVFWL